MPSSDAQQQPEVTPGTEVNAKTGRKNADIGQLVKGSAACAIDGAGVAGVTGVMGTTIAMFSRNRPPLLDLDPMASDVNAQKLTSLVTPNVRCIHPPSHPLH